MKICLLKTPHYFKPSLIQGYGVFATKKINADEIIETCPVLLIENEDCNINTAFENYYFNWRVDTELCGALALGYGSLYNHSNQANAYYESDHFRNLLVFKASRTIQKGEEICIDYGNEWFTSRDMEIISQQCKTKENSWIFSIPHIGLCVKAGFIISLLYTFIHLLKS